MVSAIIYGYGEATRGWQGPNRSPFMLAAGIKGPWINGTERDVIAM